MRQTKAPVLELIPFMVYPPLPMTKPINLTGTSTYILWDPETAPLFIFLWLYTMAFIYFLTLSTASKSPSTNIFLELLPGALHVATWTLIAPDLFAISFMVYPSLPMTRPTQSFGTSKM